MSVTTETGVWYRKAEYDALADRIRELEAALRIIASYTGRDDAALVAKQLAQNALDRTGEPT